MEGWRHCWCGESGRCGWIWIFLINPPPSLSLPGPFFILSITFISSFSMCSFVHVHMCAYNGVCVYMHCLWRSEVSHSYCSSFGALHTVLQNKVSHWPGAYRLGLVIRDGQMFTLLVFKVLSQIPGQSLYLLCLQHTGAVVPITKSASFPRVTRGLAMVVRA